VWRNEGFFIFCAWFRAGACVDADARIQCATVRPAVRKAPIQLSFRLQQRGMAFALAQRPATAKDMTIDNDGADRRERNGPRPLKRVYLQWR